MQRRAETVLITLPLSAEAGPQVHLCPLTAGGRPEERAEPLSQTPRLTREGCNEVGVLIL